MVLNCQELRYVVSKGKASRFGGYSTIQKKTAEYNRKVSKLKNKYRKIKRLKDLIENEREKYNILINEETQVFEEMRALNHVFIRQNDTNDAIEYITEIYPNNE